MRREIGKLDKLRSVREPMKRKAKVVQKSKIKLEREMNLCRAIDILNNIKDDVLFLEESLVKYRTFPCFFTSMENRISNLKMLSMKDYVLSELENDR